MNTSSVYGSVKGISDLSNHKQRRKELRAQQRAPATPAMPSVITKPARSIMFAIPAHSGGLSHLTFIALGRAATEAHARGWTSEVVMRCGDSLLVRARDVFVATFLAGDFTDLIMVDSDIGWDSGSAMRLMDHPVDLVGGAYPARGDPPEFILQHYSNELVVQPGGLAEVAGAPTGFLRISRNCAQRMTDAYAADWYRDERTAPGLRLVHLFRFELRNNVLESEDYSFCRRWRDIGGKVWIDTDLMLHHQGEKIYSGCFHRHLDEKYAQLPAEQRQPSPAAAGGDLLVLARQAVADARKTAA